MNHKYAMTKRMTGTMPTMKSHSRNGDSALRLIPKHGMLTNNASHRSGMDALNDRAISDLCILRNVIVHRDGICDDKYKDGRGVGSALPICDIGDPVSIDGILTGKLLDDATNVIFRLIKSVDSWIVGHP